MLRTASLASGEHYFIDLVVALPFSLMVQALCSYTLPMREGERRNAFLVGIFSTLIWLALLSFSVQILWSSPLAPWRIIVATAASSIHFWRRLLRAGAEQDSVPSKVAVAAAGA